MRKVDSYPIWIGHAGDGRDFRHLFDLGIRAVVQLAAEEPPLAGPRDLTVLRIPLVDGSANETVLLSLAVDSVVALAGANVPTLVCCGAGMSRSPAVVAMATARLRNIDPVDALRDLASAGPLDVAPAFWDELRRAIEPE